MSEKIRQFENLDELPCQQCEKSTIKINHILEMPSCSQECDNILEEKYLEDYTDE